MYNKFQDSGRYISFLVVEVEINNREEFRVPKTSLLFWLKQTSGHIRITKAGLASYADYNLILIYLFILSYVAILKRQNKRLNKTIQKGNIGG